MGDVVAVTGTRREASVLRGAGVIALAIGGNGAALDKALAELERPAALLSFGMAGALDPALRLGDWVIGTGVSGEGQCDAAWRARLSAQFQGAREGLCFGSDRLIASAAEKAALWSGQGALAADMESHHVARVAARLGVPFAVLRCVSDVAAHDLPRAIAVAMRPDGSLALGAVLASLVRRPGQVPDLIVTLRGFSAAYGCLKADVAGKRLT